MIPRLGVQYANCTCHGLVVQSPNLGYGTWISGTVPGFSNVPGLGVQYPNLRFGTWIRGTILGLVV